MGVELTEIFQIRIYKTQKKFKQWHPEPAPLAPTPPPPENTEPKQTSRKSTTPSSDQQNPNKQKTKNNPDHFPKKKFYTFKRAPRFRGQTSNRKPTNEKR